MKKQHLLIVGLGIFSLNVWAASVPQDFKSIRDDFPASSSSVLEKSCERVITQSQDLVKKIEEATGSRNIENTLIPYDQALSVLGNAKAYTDLLSAVHNDSDVREAASKCQQQLAETLASIQLNLKVYQAIKEVKVSDPVDRHFVKTELEDFRRNGIELDDSKRKRLKELVKEITGLSEEFKKNVDSDVREIEVTEADLKGLPEDYLKSHPLSGGKTKITTRYPDLFPFFTYSTSREARRRLAIEFGNRGYPKNEDVWKGLLEKRYEMARLLGFKTFAHYAMDDKMIKSPEKAEQFIDKITRLATPIAKRDESEMLPLLKKDHPEAKTLESYDFFYYDNLNKEKKLHLDTKALREYFEFNKVKAGLFDFASRFFAVTFEKVEGATAWDPSVDIYNMYDKGSHKFLGRFYLDLFPRENKFGHAAAFQMRSGVAGPSGRVYPEASLVCNFTKPGPNGEPAYMDANEVETFFHEFGHLMHHILSGSVRWSEFTAFAVETDFVEAPSQFLEEWVSEYDVLKKFATNKEGKIIPKDLVEKFRWLGHFGKGLQARRQMYLAAMSLTFYKRIPDGLNLLNTMIELSNRYSPYPYIEGTHFYDNFGHIAGEYTSNYYSYMWADVISRDLQSVFKAKGMMNLEVARKYRKTILEPGASKDAADLVKDFLGRPYGFNSYKAYMDKTVPTFKK